LEWPHQLTNSASRFYPQGEAEAVATTVARQAIIDADGVSLEEPFPKRPTCGCLGNSQKVANEHDLRLTDGRFMNAGQNPGQHTVAPVPFVPLRTPRATPACEFQNVLPSASPPKEFHS
jgi:hypothetical protein